MARPSAQEHSAPADENESTRPGDAALSNRDSAAGAGDRDSARVSAAEEPAPTEQATGFESATAPPGAIEASSRESRMAAKTIAATPVARRARFGGRVVAVLLPALSSIARSAALGGLILLGLVLWAQFNFKSGWVPDLLTANDLDLDARKRLIYSMVAAVVVGGAAAATWASVAELRRGGARQVERWMWLLSPLCLAPAFPLLLRWKPWKGRLDALLPTVLVCALALEVLVRQAIVAAPARATEWLSRLRSGAPALLRRWGPLGIVVLGAVLYSAFFCFYTIQWHHKIRTGNFDLGINNNLMFSGLNGRFLHSTVVFPNDPEKYLANHAKIGAYAFLPVYALFPRPETLLALQSTLLGAGALPLFGFARKRLGDWMGALVAVAYLCWYPMHAANFNEVNHIPMAAPFILATVWAIDGRHWKSLVLFFLLGTLMREDIPIGMAVIGTFLLLSGHRPLVGLVIALISSVWFVVLRFYIMDSAGDWWFPDMYKELYSPGEKGFGSVIKTLITNPFFVLWKVISKEKLWYVMHLFVPLVFLPARRWYLWAAFIPGALTTLLSTSYKPLTMYSFQYVMHWGPYLFLAAVLALESLKNQPEFGRARVWAAAAAMGFATLTTTYNAGAFARNEGTLRAGYHTASFTLSDQERERYAQLKKLVAMIPPDASVTGTERVGVHASSRVFYYGMRRGTYKADYLLASSKELELDRTKQHLTQALRRGEYGVLERAGDIALFKRGHSTAGNDQLMKDWQLSKP